MRRTLLFQALLPMVFVLLFLPGVFASGNQPVCDSSSDWVVLYATEQVTIYYQKEDKDACIAYRLKIENRTNEQRTIQFGVMGKLLPSCKSMYSSFDAYQVRTIVLDPLETVEGNDTAAELVITRWESQELPPVEVVIQNLTIL